MKITKGNSSTSFRFNNSSVILENVTNVVPSNLESFEVLQAALTATGSIDLTGRSFAITQNYSSWSSGITLSSGERSITGGTIYGASPRSWTETSAGSGVYEATLPSSVSYDQWGICLVDTAQSSPPRQQFYPTPTNGWQDHPHSYNESWLRILDTGGIENLGTVMTVDGENTPGEVIVSITITDATTANAINDLVASGNQTKLCLAIHSDANLVYLTVPASYSFDVNAGTATFTLDGGNTFKISFSGYLDIAFGGILSEAQINPGEYAISPADGKIWYKPLNGIPDNALVPSCETILTIADNISFSGTKIYGGLAGESSIPSQLLMTLPTKSISLTDCEMAFGEAGIRGTHVNADGCIFDTYLDAGLLINSCTVDNCAFIESTNRPFLFLQAKSAASQDEPGLAASTITNCYFKLEYSTHGQGLSLYQDSWQNATVKNNIFYNCVRAFSAQHTEVGNNWSGDALEFIFENNLIYWDSDSVSQYITGQCTVAMILDDSHLETQDHKSYFRHNTVILAPSILALANTENDCSIDTQALGSSKCICEANIAGTIRIIDESDAWNKTDGQWQYRNAKYGIGGRYSSLTGYGESDLSMPYASTVDNADEHIENGFHVKNGSLWETAASDDGVIGARFSPMPTAAQLAALRADPIGWSSVYVPQSIPVFNSETLVFAPEDSNDRVNEDDDFRP